MIGEISRIPVGLPSVAGLPNGTPSVAGVPNGTLVELPDWTYTPTEGLSGSSGEHLADYYGQMASNYLPQVDAFAQQNAGNMVAWDPNRFMTIEDFGYGTARGNLRGTVSQGYYIGDTFHADTPADLYVKGSDNNYYRAFGDGEEDKVNWMMVLRNIDPGTETELYRGTPQTPLPGKLVDYDPSGFTYESVGVYRKETPEEAWARQVAQGGGFTTGGSGDFGGETTLERLTKDVSSKKWGADPVNIPELQQYIDNPEWVQRDDGGKITAMRAELLPYVFREQLGEEFRDITRGGTKKAGGFGDVVGALIIGVATAGFGIAAAAGMGLTAAGTAAGGLTGAITGGTALSTTGSIVAGGITGGLGSAINGGNIGTGILTGGIGGGLTPLVSQGLAGTGADWLKSGSMANSALSSGVTGAAKTAVTGGNIGDAFLAGAGTSAVMGGLKEAGLTTGNGMIDGMIGSLVRSSFNSALANPPAAQGVAPATNTAAAPTTPEPADSTFASFAVPTRSSYFRRKP